VTDLMLLVQQLWHQAYKKYGCNNFQQLTLWDWPNQNNSEKISQLKSKKVCGLTDFYSASA